MTLYAWEELITDYFYRQSSQVAKVDILTLFWRQIKWCQKTLFLLIRLFIILCIFYTIVLLRYTYM